MSRRKIELTVLIAAAAVLLFMSLPLISQTREEAEKELCINNLKRIGVAFTLYANDYGGVIARYDQDGYWHHFLHPYLKEDSLYCPSAKRHPPFSSGSCWWTYGMRQPWGIANADDPYLIYNDPIFRGYRLSKIAKPADYILVGDTITNSNLSYIGIKGFPGSQYSLLPEQFNGEGAVHLRHDNKAHILFADGHVEACGASRIKQAWQKEIPGAMTINMLNGDGTVATP